MYTVNYFFCIQESLDIMNISCCTPVLCLWHIIFQIIYILIANITRREPVYLGKVQNKVVTILSWFTVFICIYV